MLNFFPILGDGFGRVIRLVTACGLVLFLSQNCVCFAQTQSITPSAYSNTYYVDNLGSDANSGFAGSPWRHVGYALSNAPPGSAIFLTSGQTFTEDNLTVTNKFNMLLTASGVAPAILRNATTGTNQCAAIASEQGIAAGRDVLAVVNSSWVTLSNLCFYGTGVSNTVNWACIDVLSLNNGYCTNLTVINCETTNANLGISIYACGNSPNNMFGNLSLIGNKIHEIGFDGVLEWSYYGDQQGAIYCSNAITANNEVYNVTGRPDLNSGTGIALFNVSHWECYSNYVHDCGQQQGPSGGGGAGGIFPVFYSDHVHIWRNEVARIYAKPQGDGVGIDLDRGTLNSIVEGNFVHDCGGAGYYSYQAYGNNIWRWNIGINDGTGLCNTNYSSPGSRPEIWFTDGGYLLTNSYEYVYNNTFIGHATAFQSTDDSVVPNTALILNNIFGQLTFKDIWNNPIALVFQDLPINSHPPLTTNWYFSGNEYITTNSNFLIEWPSGKTNNFLTLGQWRQFGQEFGAGMTNNPQFVVGNGVIASNYYVQSSSLLVNAGIDVHGLYGISPGAMDYYGNTPLAAGNNIGGLVGSQSSGTPTNGPVPTPVIQLTAGSLAFGTVLVGTSVTNSFTVQNIGSGTLNGTAFLGAPFSILSGGNYNLSANQSQTVMVVFNPSVAGTYNQSASFTGGGGTNAMLWGIATSSNNITQSGSQTNFNVTDFGAHGDAAVFFVNTVSNSPVLTTTNILSIADIGKTIELFGAGPLGTSTNHQDLAAVIVNVLNSTNIYLDRVAGATLRGCYSIYGTNNASAFQACINAAPSNSVINIPDGTYLIIGSQVLDTNFICSNPFETYPSIVINKGGVVLMGQSRANTVLMGCGAWQNKGAWAYRGYLFACQGPVTNNGPLIFDTMTMDGGVQQGYTGVTAFPASTATGDGWDVTHDAVIDVGLPPFHNTKIFRNCTITRWRGEQFKSVTSGWDGFISITNCSFGNGDGSGINFNFTHDIDNCQFANLFETMEFYQAYCSNTCYFQNNFVTNVGAIMAINGAQSNRPNPSYIVRNNTFCGSYGNGIQTTPAQNLTVSNNLFVGGGFPITIGVLGYQGSTMNSNILVVCNVFSNNWTPIEIEGSGANSLTGFLVSNNVAYGTSSHLFAESESGGWGTNMVFVDNYTTNFSTTLVSSGMSGQYFLDDDSNVFPPHQIIGVGGSNEIGYEYGERDTIWGAQASSVFYTDDTHFKQIPAGAKLHISNMTSLTLPLYLSASLSGTPISMTNGFSGTFYWNTLNSTWTPVNPGNSMVPPRQLHVTVTN